MMTKFKQAEHRKIMRSEINFAHYNPRKMSESAKKKLKRNIKKVGLLGGIVWNESTHNLVSGHQKITILDDIEGYNHETRENDYPIEVEVTQFDEKTEKEQNVFMNSRSAQGEFDDIKLKELLTEIDYSNAGLDEVDLNLLGIGNEVKIQNNDRVFSMDDFEDNHEIQQVYDEAVHSEENTEISRDVDFYDDSADNQAKRHAEVQKIKDRIQNKADSNDGGALSYVVISFNSPDDCARFLEMMGYEPDNRYLNGAEFSHRIEFGE